VAFLMGLTTLLTSFCGYCKKWFTLPWVAGNALAFGAMLAAMAVFFVNGYDSTYRTILGQQGQTYTVRGRLGLSQNPGNCQAELGFSFWCGVSATFTYLVSLCLATATAVISFFHDRMVENKTYPKHMQV